MKHVDKNEKMKFCQFPQCFVFEIIDLLFFFRDYLMPGTKVGVILPCCHPFIYCSRIDYQCTHISPKSLKHPVTFPLEERSAISVYTYIHWYMFCGDSLC